MLILISPAKSLDFESELVSHASTAPRFPEETQRLVSAASNLSKAKLQQIMPVSDKLIDLNHGRYKDFWDQPERAAIYAFSGDVYTGFEAKTVDDAGMRFAQDHLRILSGLYGLLRPLDRIQPHRLEMGTKLENPRGKNLYEFWGSKPTEALNAALAASESKILLNLASNEYFRAVKRKLVCATIIEPQFREHRDGKLKMISFFAKRARGTMARYMVQRRVSTEAELLAFAEDGYVYDAVGSTPGKPLFVRKSEAT